MLTSENVTIGSGTNQIPSLTAALLAGGCMALITFLVALLIRRNRRKGIKIW
jgi:hypothetical protein